MDECESFSIFDSNLNCITMASVRRLKKDMDYLTAAVISDCLSYNSTQENVNPEVASIVENMLVFRADMRSKISSGKKQTMPNGKKAYYKDLFKDLLKTVDANFMKLSEIIKKA